MGARGRLTIPISLLSARALRPRITHIQPYLPYLAAKPAAPSSVWFRDVPVRLLSSTRPINMAPKTLIVCCDGS